MSESIYLPGVAFVVSLLTAVWIHPKVVRIAAVKNITDCPDERKLHRSPVPVLGGVVVFLGIAMGVGLTSIGLVDAGLANANLPNTGAKLTSDIAEMMFWMAMLVLMLYTGTIDDILGLTAWTRLIIEVVAVLIMIYVGGFVIDNFHGLWGIGHISLWVGVPLTVVAVVGIINAINLIDGVNGLSSGYCMMASMLFWLVFNEAGNTSVATLALSGVGALIPFFVHNVFGNRQRMFIGDGGTLMMGMMLSLFVLQLLKQESSMSATTPGDLSLIAFCLSVLSVPVFDTLRVMLRRIVRGLSPFTPDKTHLHHYFIACGMSHIKTTLSILSLNAVVVAAWYAAYRCGTSQAVQLYVVVALSVCFTTIVPLLLRRTADIKEKQKIHTNR